MEIIKPDKDIIKLHLLFLEKIEILQKLERKYFLSVLIKLSNPITIIDGDLDLEELAHCNNGD